MLIRIGAILLTAGLLGSPAAGYGQTVTDVSDSTETSLFIYTMKNGKLRNAAVYEFPDLASCLDAEDEIANQQGRPPGVITNRKPKRKRRAKNATVTVSTECLERFPSLLLSGQ